MRQDSLRLRLPVHIPLTGHDRRQADNLLSKHAEGRIAGRTIFEQEAQNGRGLRLPYEGKRLSSAQVKILSHIGLPVVKPASEGVSGGPGAGEPAQHLRAGINDLEPTELQAGDKIAGKGGAIPVIKTALPEEATATVNNGLRVHQIKYNSANIRRQDSRIKK